MKKLVFCLAALILAAAFAGCAPEKSEEITEKYVEKIVLDFGAEKLENGKIESHKTRGFFFENYFEDGSALEMKYYFSWAAGKFVEKYSDWNTRFASPHGIGYSFPEEEFEEIIGTYFDAKAENLRGDKDFYCKEHNAYCWPGGGTGLPGQQEIEILSYEKNGDVLSVHLSVGKNFTLLKVLLTENGGYRFLSHLPEQ
ncbi:MAG: hypothetical protein E7479_07990 [Ruminococcaceae bacterium]|nr:hypothetical protein [Oscillospiraceae bacterium]